MMKYLHLGALFSMLVFCIFGKGQTKTGLTKDTIRSEAKFVITSYGRNEQNRVRIPASGQSERGSRNF